MKISNWRKASIIHSAGEVRSKAGKNEQQGAMQLSNYQSLYSTIHTKIAPKNSMCFPCPSAKLSCAVVKAKKKK